jgi:hypothetical protein
VKQRGILLAAGCAVLLEISAFVLLAFWGSAEPSYQGQSLSRWLEQYQSARLSGTRSVEAAGAIRQMGTNALPTLIRMIRARDSLPKQVFRRVFESMTPEGSELRYREGGHFWVIVCFVLPDCRL